MILHCEFLLLGKARQGQYEMVIAKKQKKTSGTKKLKLFPFLL